MFGLVWNIRFKSHHTCSTASNYSSICAKCYTMPLLSTTVCCSSFKRLQVRERIKSLYLINLDYHSSNYQLELNPWYHNPKMQYMLLKQGFSHFLYRRSLCTHFFFKCEWLDLDVYYCYTTVVCQNKKCWSWLLLCCEWIWMCWYTWHDFGRGFTMTLWAKIIVGTTIWHVYLIAPWWKRGKCRVYVFNLKHQMRI